VNKNAKAMINYIKNLKRKIGEKQMKRKCKLVIRTEDWGDTTLFQILEQKGIANGEFGIHSGITIKSISTPDVLSDTIYLRGHYKESDAQVVNTKLMKSSRIVETLHKIINKRAQSDCQLKIGDGRDFYGWCYIP